VTKDHQVSAELSRELSLFHITMMGLGMMIGAGVFIGIGNTIHESGPGGVLLTFSLNGVIAMMTAMSYAELSSAIPRAGGAYNFARIGFGRGTSFLAGWMEWFASSVAGSLYAVTFAVYTVDYLSQLSVMAGVLDQVPPGWTVKLMAVAIASFFLYINYRGASETGTIGAIMTLGQTAFLILIGIVGVMVAIKDPSRLVNFKPFLPHGWGMLLVTMGFTSVAFEGYEVIAQAGDETIDPRRNLPKAMLYSVCIVTVTYVLVAFAAVVAVQANSPDLVKDGVVLVPWEWIGSFGDLGFGKAVARLMPFGGFLLTLAVIFASTSALNATIFSATRASYALGRDRMLPGFFSLISRKRKTPWIALLLTGFIMVGIAVFLPLKHVVASASIMFLFLFFLVNICVIKIRHTMADEMQYGFLMPFFPFPPIIALICQALLALHLLEFSRIAWMIAPAWIGVGLMIYCFYSKSRALATEDEILVLEEEDEPSGEDAYRVMVAVANPQNAIRMVRTTYMLCSAKHAQVELLHMMPVPELSPLADAKSRHMLEGREGIVEAMLYLAPEFPLGTTVRYCRNAARGIISAVREKKTDMLIMGWRGATQRLFRMGSTLDPVIEQSPCNVVVLKDCGGNQKFKRVLVPLAGGPNGAFALEIASILAHQDEGEVVAISVARETPGMDFDVQDFVMHHRKDLPIAEDRLNAQVIFAQNVVEAILKEAENYDLVVLGCTREPLLSQMTKETVPEIIARQCPKPVVMVKASGGLRSWIKRWI